MDERIGSKVWMIRLGGTIHEGALVKIGDHSMDRAKVRTAAGYIHEGFTEDICFTAAEAIARAEREIDGLECTIYFLNQLVERLWEEADMEMENAS